MTSAPVQASFTSSVSLIVQPFSAAMASQVSTRSAAGHVLLGAAGDEVQAQLGAHDHERTSHVVGSIAHEHQRLALDVVVEVLLNRQDVSEHLGGMPLGGQAVPHRHGSAGSQLFHVGLREAAEFDAVVETVEHAGGVLDGLLLAHLGAARIEVGHAHAEIHGADLERAARAGGRLLEQQDDVLALEVTMGGTGQFQVLEFAGQLQQVLDFLGGEVEEAQEVATAQASRHRSFLSTLLTEQNKIRTGG